MHATTSGRSLRRGLLRAGRSAGALALLVSSLSCAGDSGTPGGPSFTTGIVLGQVGLGVVATPSQNTGYAVGSVVNYSFTAQDGVSSVYVTLNDVAVPSSGTVTISQNHTFTAVINNQVGFHAPEFSGRTAAGQTIRLSDYAGKIVLVDFSEPTCAGSPPEAVALKTHYAAYHPRGLEIITVLVSCPALHNCPTNSPALSSSLSQWTTTYGLPYPVVSDLNGATAIYNWSIPEKTTDFPATYIVSASGNILYRFRGFDGPAISAALAVLYP